MSKIFHLVNFFASDRIGMMTISARSKTSSILWWIIRPAISIVSLRYAEIESMSFRNDRCLAKRLIYAIIIIISLTVKMKSHTLPSKHIIRSQRSNGHGWMFFKCFAASRTIFRAGFVSTATLDLRELPIWLSFRPLSSWYRTALAKPRR